MKKISFILVLVVFTFFACQNDNVHTDALNDTELNQNVESLLEVGVFNPISEKSAKNLDAYLDSQLNSLAKGDGVRYGCVTFVDGVAIIDEDCTITSGVPRDFRDCDLKAVRYIECAPNLYNPNCIICAVAYVIECDGRLGWVLGYNIICDFSQPVPL